MRNITFICAGLLGVVVQVGIWAGMANAQALTLATPAMRTFEQVEENGTYTMATGPYLNGQVQTHLLTGAYSLEAWRLVGNTQPSHQIMANLGRQLADAGYDVLYQCAEIQCGGFDFRFGIDVVSEPLMHVDLGDFQYLAARKLNADATKNAGADSSAYITLLVSRSPGAGYIQIARIGPAGTGENGAADMATVTSTMTDPAIIPAGGRALSSAPFMEQLTQNGFAVLSDLEFKTGSSDLGAGPFDSLAQLAEYLLAHPDSTVALVGHSDAEGALQVNVTLSKHRAESVRARLIDLFALPANQLTAEGVGFLAPLGSNATDAGRTQNRRVEVVLTSTR